MNYKTTIKRSIGEMNIETVFETNNIEFAEEILNRVLPVEVKMDTRCGCEEDQDSEILSTIRGNVELMHEHELISDTEYSKFNNLFNFYGV